MWRILLSSLLLSGSGATAAATCDALLRGDASLGQADATCANGLLEGGRAQQVCHWRHDYRSAQADAHFLTLRDLVEGCLGTMPLAEEAPPVNHPDSFRQARYMAQGWTVSVSHKDKAGAGQSLVFLSLSRVLP
jgi:hypothetical protein